MELTSTAGVDGPARTDAVGARDHLPNSWTSKASAKEADSSPNGFCSCAGTHVGRADHQTHEPVAEAADHPPGITMTNGRIMIRPWSHGKQTQLECGFRGITGAGIHQLDISRSDGSPTSQHPMTPAMTRNTRTYVPMGLVVRRIDVAPPSGRWELLMIVMGVVVWSSLPCFKSCLAVTLWTFSPVAIVPSRADYCAAAQPSDTSVRRIGRDLFSSRASGCNFLVVHDRTGSA